MLATLAPNCAVLVAAVFLSASAHATLPCDPAAPNDPQPWVHVSAILDSFPRETPAPEWVGDFLDEGGYYWLKLWRDSQGYFGSLASPVVEQDSPTAPIENVQWDPAARVLQFLARPSGTVYMSGVLTGSEFRLTDVKGRFSSEPPVLRFDDKQPRFDWRSRSQFECAMKLRRRK